MGIASRLKSSAVLAISAFVGLMRIWFRDNRINRSRIGQVAVQTSINSYRESALLYVAARLGLADLLAGSPRDSHELALSTGAHEPSLYRILRGLVVMGILSEKRNGRFALTSLGTWLLSGKRDSLRNAAILCGEGRYLAFGSLFKSVMTGEPAWSSPGTTCYEYRKQNPELDKSFNMEMTRRTGWAVKSILASYDFNSFRTVADIGGGHGALLAAILKSYPSHSGILFDQHHVVEGARHYLEKAGIAARCRIVEGDFLNPIPISADMIILKNILHNWDDERCRIILKNCRDALGNGCKLLLVERLMPERVKDNADTIWLDLWMLAQMGGRERTADEYRELLAASGFSATQILPTSSQLWIIEAARTDLPEPQSVS